MRNALKASLVQISHLAVCLSVLIMKGTPQTPTREYKHTASCQIEDTFKFTKCHQRKYLANIVRQPNTILTKHLIIKDNKATKPVRKSILESMVPSNKQCTTHEFDKRSINKRILNRGLTLQSSGLSTSADAR